METLDTLQLWLIINGQPVQNWLPVALYYLLLGWAGFVFLTNFLWALWRYLDLYYPAQYAAAWLPWQAIHHDIKARATFLHGRFNVQLIARARRAYDRKYVRPKENTNGLFLFNAGKSLPLSSLPEYAT